MFRMAFPAFLLFLQAAMKPLLAFHILTDFFMTILAQLGLRRLVKPLMAFGAVFFPFRMALDHLAWHQGRFQTVGPGGPKTPEGH